MPKGLKTTVELVNTTKKTRKPPKPKRQGPLSNGEKLIVSEFAAEQPSEISKQQVQALAKTLNRSTETIANAVTRARESFVSRAERYADAHAEAMEAALANGDAKSLEVATKASQWAMTNLSHEGKRIIEKEVVSPVVPRVMIGVKIGGLDLDKIQESGAVIVTDAEIAQ